MCREIISRINSLRMHSIRGKNFSHKKRLGWRREITFRIFIFGVSFCVGVNHRRLRKETRKLYWNLILAAKDECWRSFGRKSQGNIYVDGQKLEASCGNWKEMSSVNWLHSLTWWVCGKCNWRMNDWINQNERSQLENINQILTDK